MDVAKLQELFAEQVTVRHGGHEYTLRAPTMPEAAAVLTRFGKAAEALPDGADARVPYLAALAEAIELTLEVEGGELPDGIGRRIVLGTGGIASPVALAAARLCGLPLIGVQEAPDDLPT